MRTRQFWCGDPDGKSRLLGSFKQTGNGNDFDSMDDSLELALGRGWVATAAAAGNLDDDAGITAIVNRLTAQGYDHARTVDPCA